QQKLIEMTQDPSPRVRLEAIAALSDFKDQTTVNALLAAADKPVDADIGYALMESFKHLKPVWMEMFLQDKNYLADQPSKASLLLRPLASKSELQVPGFITDDPEYTKYGVAPLSEKDLELLQGVPTVEEFKQANMGLLFPEEMKAKVQKAEERSTGEVVIGLAAL